jgi:hypothetical protein
MRGVVIATADNNGWDPPLLSAQLQRMQLWRSPPTETAKGEHLGKIEVERLQHDEEVHRGASRDCAQNDLGQAHGGGGTGHRRSVEGQGRNIGRRF